MVSSIWIMPFRFIRCRKATRNTLLCLFPRKSFYLFMTKSRALFIENIIATRMNFLNIIPKHLPVSSFSISLLIDAHLSQVFQNNFFALDKFITIFGGTVLSSSEAVGMHKFFITIDTDPKYKPWCHHDTISEHLVQFHEILNEIKS